MKILKHRCPGPTQDLTESKSLGFWTSNHKSKGIT